MNCRCGTCRRFDDCGNYWSRTAGRKSQRMGCSSNDAGVHACCASAAAMARDGGCAVAANHMVAVNHCPVCERRFAMRFDAGWDSGRVSQNLARAREVQRVISKLQCELSDYEQWRITSGGNGVSSTLVVSDAQKDVRASLRLGGKTWKTDENGPYWARKDTEYGNFGQPFASMPARYEREPSTCHCYWTCCCQCHGKNRESHDRTDTARIEPEEPAVVEEDLAAVVEEDLAAVVEEDLTAVVEEDRAAAVEEDLAAAEAVPSVVPHNVSPTAHMNPIHVPLQGEDHKIGKVAHLHLSPSGSVDIILHGPTNVKGRNEQAEDGKELDFGGLDVSVRSLSFHGDGGISEFRMRSEFTDEEVDKLEEDVFLRHDRLRALFD